MPWPAQSADLNPNLWMMVKRQIGNNFMIQIEEQLNAIPIEYINKLIASMPNRIG